MAQIKNKFIADNAITGSKLRLDNNEAARARNSGDSADIELLKLDTSDILQFLSHPRISTSASNSDDVLTLKDLSAELEGLKPKGATRAASVANVNIVTAPSSIDGVTLVSGDRVLLKDQTIASQNGIRVFTAAGASLDRSTDMDSLTPIDEVNGAYVPVQEGTNAGKFFVQSGTVNILDTDPLNFVIFRSVTDLSGGDGIDITSDVVSVKLSGSPYLEFNTGDLQAKVSADYASAAAGDVMDAADIKTKVDAVELLASNKQDPISGSGAIDVTADVVSATLDGSTMSQSVSGLKVADAGIDELQLSSNVDSESFVIAAGYTPAIGTVTAGDTLQEAFEKVEAKVDNVQIPIPTKEEFTLDGLDISNGFITLSNTPIPSTSNVQVVGGPVQREGADYTIAAAVVTFAGDLASGGASAVEVGDVVIVNYVY